MMHTVYAFAGNAADTVTVTFRNVVPTFAIVVPYTVPLGAAVADAMHVHGVELHGSKRTARTLVTDKPAPEIVTTGCATSVPKVIGENNVTLGTDTVPTCTKPVDDAVKLAHTA